MRIDRMLAIVVMLLNRERITARELAGKFEVSIRTIYRDLEAVNQAGVPIISYPGNDGGFGIMDNYKIDRQLLTFNDMLAILSALKGVNTTLADLEIDTAIQKISSLVPKERNDELELRYEQLVIDVSPWGFREEDKWKQKEIYRAITDCKLVKLNYGNLKGEKTLRVVEPMTLLFKGYAWYLLGYCRLREDFRSFKLSRIGELTVLDEEFTRRKYSYREFPISRNQKNTPIHLKLKFSPTVRANVEEYFNPENITYQDDGCLIVEVDWPEDEWVYANILSYGEQVEILEPEEIREKIRERAAKLFEVYHNMV